MPAMSVKLTPVLSGEQYPEATYTSHGSDHTYGVMRRIAPADGAAFDVEGSDAIGFVSLEFLEGVVSKIKAARRAAKRRK